MQDEVWNVHHVDVIEAERLATVTIYLMAGGRVVYEFGPNWLDYDDIGIDVTRTDHST